jgi:FkbM family methyltransferase
MRILWHSVAPWVGSGYGQQTAQAVPRIAALGHDIAISAYYGLLGAKQRWNGITCYPAYAESYGKDTVVPHALHHFGAGEGDIVGDVASRGLIITLGDVWVFDQPTLQIMNVAAWVPVDHETVPPMIENWFQVTGAIPIAMSRFGQAKLEEIGLQPLYVPHGIDTSVFRPGDKAEARARVGLPEDAFVIAMVAANFGRDGARKAFHEQIVAFAQLRRKHPDMVLALHTDITNPHGVNIRDLLGDLPESSYIVTDQYAYRVGVPASTVADIYRAADVLTNTSWGEGFGIPIVEAQACGTPVVVTDTTAMPELVGAGWKVPGQPLWHDSQRAWARQPLIGGIVDAYEQAYEHARDEDMRAQAWAFAQDYDADRVLEDFWVPALKQLEAAVESRRTAATKPPDPGSLHTKVWEADGLLWLNRGKGTDDWIGWSQHEETLQPVMEELLPAGGVFLDVGAHIGRWTLRMAGRASRVVAVEPNPDTLQVLRKHLAINDISNVTVLEFAAWDEQSFLTLQDNNHRLAGGSTRTLPIGEPDGEEHVAVPARRLDSFAELHALDRLDLVKMDVEGSDLHALRGMAGLLAKFRPALLIERHDVYGYYQLDELTALLTELGYQWREVKYLTAPYLVCTLAPAEAG